MGTYIIRRLIIGVIVLLLVTVLVFLLVRLLPGDPLVIYTSGVNRIGPEEYEALREKFGLNDPLPVQYFNWLGQILRGDLGKSILIGQPITELIGDVLPRTAYIGIITLTIGVFGGIFVGIICALRRGSWLDNTLTTLANIGMTLPQFWLAIVLMYLISYKLGWLPTSGWVSPLDNFWESTKRLIMPVLAVSIGSIGGMARLTRSCMLEVMRADYIRTAWAKGLKERVIVVRHQMKNALIPVVTSLGGSLGAVLGGSVFIETIYAIPGMGRLMVTATFDNDYQVVQATTLIFGAIIIVSNLIVDISWGWLDPRIRLS